MYVLVNPQQVVDSDLIINKKNASKNIRESKKSHKGATL